MFLRTFRVCNTTYLENEIKMIYKIGKNLCHPNYFLEKCQSISTKIFNKNSNNLPTTDGNFSVNSLVIPYFSKFHNIPRMLKPLGINVIFKFTNCLNDLIIKNSPESDSNIIYKISCSDCNSIYVGQTSKTLNARIKQHKNYVKNAYDNSALFKHAFQNDHCINWVNSSKIINCNNWVDRNIIESFIILCNSNTLNISKGIYSFDPIMTCLLKTDMRNLLQSVSD